MQSVAAVPARAAADPSDLIVVVWNMHSVCGPRAITHALSKMQLTPQRIRLFPNLFEGAVVIWFTAQWQVDTWFSKLAGTHRRLVSAMGKDACVARWSSESIPTLFRVALRELPRVPDQEPLVDPDDDPYDPRKPEYVETISKEDAESHGRGLVQRQIAKLESSLAQRSGGVVPEVRQHYESVLAEMRLSAGAGAVHPQLPRRDSAPELPGADGPMASYGHARAWSDPNLLGSGERDSLDASTASDDDDTSEALQDCKKALAEPPARPRQGAALRAATWAATAAEAGA